LSILLLLLTVDHLTLLGHVKLLIAAVLVAVRELKRSAFVQSRHWLTIEQSSQNDLFLAGLCFIAASATSGRSRGRHFDTLLPGIDATRSSSIFITVIDTSRQLLAGEAQLRQTS
jgi:hypothetical protein